MQDNFTLLVNVFAIAGSGVVAGIVFSFSTFVMKALSQLPARTGIVAMQRINVTIINPLFMLVFLGTPAASLYLAIVGVIDLSEPGVGYLLAGSVLHIVGSLLVTIAFNVPRNNELATLDPDNEEASTTWSKYLREWTAWNHVRTVSSLGSTVLLSLGLLWTS